MNLDSLSNHIYYNNYFFKNNITRIFAENYFINKNHKYDLYHFYIFCTDRIKNEINTFFDNKHECSAIFVSNLEGSNINELILSNGELNFKNERIKQISKFFTMLYIGDFIYKDMKFASMFLNVIDDSYVSGYSIDIDEGDEFFKSYQKINLFVNNDNVDINSEINKNLDNYSKFKPLKFEF